MLAQQQLHEQDGKQVACLHSGEKHVRASLEVDDKVTDILDDIVMSCLYFALLKSRTGISAGYIGEQRHNRASLLF